MRVDRDVAVSEARTAQEELHRFKHREVEALTKKVNDLHEQLVKAQAEKEEMVRIANDGQVCGTAQVICIDHCTTG